jgi:alginate O-acetyltransferase complex protein AlgJ
MKPVAAWFPGFQPLRLDDFSIKTKRDTAGDLAGMIGGGGLLSDIQYFFTPKKAFSATVVEKNKKPLDLFTMENRDDSLPRVVIFRDSFFTALVPFIAESFRRSAYYWERWDTETPMVEIIGRHRPDIVLDEVVERILKQDVSDFFKQTPTYMRSLVKPNSQ